MQKKLNFAVIICLVLLVFVPNHIHAQEVETPQEAPTLLSEEEMEEERQRLLDDPFTPLISAMVNLTSSAAFVKTECQIGNSRVSEEFSRKQAIIDRTAINQIIEQGYSKEVAIKYMQERKKRIANLIFSEIQKEQTFCNGDYALFISSFYSRFITNSEDVILEINEEINEELQQAEEAPSDRTLQMIRDLKQ